MFTDENRPSVVWDLDSTLADTRQRRHLCPTVDPERTWAEYAMACGQDRPFSGAVTLNRMLYDAGYVQHILTWRPWTVLEPTIRWLAANNVLYDVLRLRMPDDPHDSTVFKLDYLERLRSLDRTPALVIEDWPAAAVAIEAAGFPVICVNPCYGERP